MEKALFDEIMRRRKALFQDKGIVTHESTIAYHPDRPPLYFTDARCPRCDRSVLTRPRAGLIEFDILSAEGLPSRLFVSFFLGDEFTALENEAAVSRTGQVLQDVACPHCKASLVTTFLCSDCGAPLFEIDVFAYTGKRFEAKACPRKGCYYTRVELAGKDLTEFFRQEFGLTASRIPWRSPRKSGRP
jgi:hypothetical protein